MLYINVQYFFLHFCLCCVQFLLIIKINVNIIQNQFLAVGVWFIGGSWMRSVFTILGRWFLIDNRGYSIRGWLLFGCLYCSTNSTINRFLIMATNRFRFSKITVLPFFFTTSTSKERSLKNYKILINMSFF